MSAFWVASDPPEVGPALTAWCEKEVEFACRDLMASAKVVGTSFHDEKVPTSDGLALIVLLDTPWDDSIENSVTGVCPLMLEVAEGIAVYGKIIPPGQERDFMEARLKAMEETISKIRAMYGDA